MASRFEFRLIPGSDKVALPGATVVASTNPDEVIEVAVLLRRQKDPLEGEANLHLLLQSVAVSISIATSIRPLMGPARATSRRSSNSPMNLGLRWPISNLDAAQSS